MTAEAKSTPKAVAAAAAKVGGTVDDSGEFATLDAPKQKVWEANGEHEFVVYADEGRGLMWGDLLMVARAGVYDCPDGAACDYPGCAD